MVYCGNNAFSPELKTHGGKDQFGTHAECFKKGYARGYHQAVPDIPHFIRKWSGKYKPYIQQNMWYRDSAMPTGFQPAS